MNHHKQKRLVQRIKRKIVREMRKIINGYKVVWTEVDGCDEYGTKYLVECKNGYSGYSWDVRPAIINSLKGYFKKILENGIEYNNKQYYIKDDIFNQIFTADLSSQLFRNVVDYKFNINLVEDESEIKAIKEEIVQNSRFADYIKLKIEKFDANNKERAYKKLEKYKRSTNYIEPITLDESLDYLNFLDYRPDYIENFITDLKVSPFTSYKVFNNGMNSNQFIKKYYTRFLENPLI